MNRLALPRVKSIQYTVFNPSACAFPPPRVPFLPMLTRSALGRHTASEFDLVGLNRPRRIYTRGRYALFDAYRLCGVGQDGCLLAPAYHCRTMLDPAISLGADLVLYKLDQRLAPDLESLRALVAATQQPVRAMLLTHYFGFAQDAPRIKAFCDSHDIALIEDCSHALFDLRGSQRLGQHGRYTIASPYKLFPCEEGGLLIPGSGGTFPPFTNRPAGIKAEFQTLAAALQRMFAHRNAKFLATEADHLDEQIGHIVRGPIERGVETRPRLDGMSHMYLKREEALAGSITSRLLMRLCNIGHVTAQRRINYQLWSSAVKHLPHCRALFPILPDDCVPYMFPLHIDHPDPHFFVLKKLGMPIWRWDEMAVSECSVSSPFSRNLLHLPCHQALSPAELHWMIAAVSKVMKQVAVPS